MSAEALERHLAENPAQPAQVVLPVHFAGHTADVEAVSRIARAHEAYVIEDASHSIGGRYRDGSRVGSCSHSDMTTFSFHPVKTMTTGEGGAVTTNDPELYRRLMTLRTHGITRDPQELGKNPGPWYYEMQMLGYNYRMTDIQAALGRTQLKKLDAFVARRRELVAKYNTAFSGIPWITTPWEDPGRETAWHLYILQLDWDAIGIDRPTAMKQLHDQGVGTQVLYIPVPDQPYYREHYPVTDSSVKHVRNFYEHALALPLYPALTNQDQDRVITAVKALR
jgi:dTDP-4-amino-4,6-dideoxygalactose transaminase